MTTLACFAVGLAIGMLIGAWLAKGWLYARGAERARRDDAREWERRKRREEAHRAIGEPYDPTEEQL